MKSCKKLGILVHGDYIFGLPGETSETIERTIKFAEELDCETIQVSIAHPYPGTSFNDYLLKHGYLTKHDMSDELGHQLPNIQYPGLNRHEIVDAVEDFYGRYYFRPRIIYRILRKALFDKTERNRLFKEAREYLTLRSKRKKFAKSGADS